jgi:hypothetical protein
LAKIAFTWSRTVWADRNSSSAISAVPAPRGDQAGDLLLAIGEVVGLDDDGGDLGRCGRLDDHGHAGEDVVGEGGVADQPGSPPGPDPAAGGPVAVPAGDGQGAEDRAQHPHGHPDTEVAGQVLLVGQLGQPGPGLLVGRGQAAVAVEQQQPGPATGEGLAEEAGRSGLDPERLPKGGGQARHQLDLPWGERGPATTAEQVDRAPGAVAHPEHGP